MLPGRIAFRDRRSAALGAEEWNAALEKGDEATRVGWEEEIEATRVGWEIREEEEEEEIEAR